jgi:hypothetical protein
MTDKYKIILTREAPEMGDGIIMTAELETQMNLKELSEVLGKKDEQGLIEVRIIKLPEKSQLNKGEHERANLKQ